MTQNLTSYVSWSVVPSIVATISPTGLATADFANAAAIQAAVPGVSGSTSPQALVVSGLSPAVPTFPVVTTDFALASNGGTAFAQNNSSSDPVTNLNDGKYGDSSSWVSTSASSFAGISFSKPTTLCGIAWSTDNTGADLNRAFGIYTVQYTTVTNPGANTPASAWVTIGSVAYTSPYFDLATPAVPPWFQHVYAFNPTPVTGIRIETQSTPFFSASYIAFDEIRLFAQSPVFTASDGSLMVLGTAGDDKIDVAASRDASGAVIPGDVTITFNTTGAGAPMPRTAFPSTSSAIPATTRSRLTLHLRVIFTLSKATATKPSRAAAAAAA